MMKNTNNFHVIKDPVHGVMQFSDTENRLIKPFINHPYFQRLRHIRQVGMADLIFPGAVYTRFNHSLGCCYVGSQIANKIGLADDDKQLVVLACLLHDIGHGPFSHAFEDLFTQKCLRHEEWTPSFLNEFCHDDFLTVYNQLNPDLPLTVEKIGDIQAMIMHRYVKNTLLSDIVSSQLDADRLDYLLRDSHFCGVKYGEFDFRWMLHCLAPVETSQGWHLGVTQKGVGVVEHYLVARWLMIRNIYHHDKKQAAERLLTKFLTQLAKSMPHEHFLESYRQAPLGRLLVNINAFNNTIQEQKPTREMKDDFLSKNFSLYKKLCDLHINVLIAELADLESEHDVVQLAKRIHHRQLPKSIALNLEDIHEAQQHIDHLKRTHLKIRDWQLEILSIPRYCYEGDRDPIWVKKSSGNVQPLHEFSMLVNSLSNQQEHVCHLFIDNAIVNMIEIKELMDRWTKK